MPLPRSGAGHYKLGSVVRPSVRLCLSVCYVPRPNSRTERPRKPKIVQWKPTARVTREPI